MAPTRAMTDDTIVDENNGPQSPTSPTHTDSTEATLNGDAVIEIGQLEHTRARESSISGSSASGELGTQPECNEKTKRPSLIRRVKGSFKSTPDPFDVTETRTRKLEETPNGFPRLAAFQSSEANFALYRSFTYLHSRILLDLQDEITTLEKDLDEIDWDDFDEFPDRLRSRDIDNEQAAHEGDKRNRRVILKELREKLMEYDEVLIKARTLESFQRPSDRNYRSVRRYHHNTRALLDSEMDSIRTREDTVSLRSGREWAAFDGGVETIIGQVDSWLKWGFRLKEQPLQKYLRTPDLRAKTTNTYISLYSSSRIDKLINILITLVIFVLLVVPVITMYRLTSVALVAPDSSSPTNSTTGATTSPSTGEGGGRGGGGTSAADINTRNTFNAVGVLIVFTLLFSAAMSLLTKAARHELFAASAAYCAILVVFIGNFTGPGN